MFYPLAWWTDMFLSIGDGGWGSLPPNINLEPWQPTGYTVHVAFGERTGSRKSEVILSSNVGKKEADPCKKKKKSSTERTVGCFFGGEHWISIWILLAALVTWHESPTVSNSTFLSFFFNESNTEGTNFRIVFICFTFVKYACFVVVYSTSVRFDLVKSPEVTLCCLLRYEPSINNNTILPSLSDHIIIMQL